MKTFLPQHVAGTPTVLTDTTGYWLFSPGERVTTVDGAGVVTDVLDGPFPSTEVYIIELDNGRGGGEYPSSQILGSLSVTARRYSDTPLSCDKCGRTATTSMSGGRDGHSMLCPTCKDERTSKTAMPAEASSEEITDMLLVEAARVEPKVTSDMKRISTSQGGALRGIDARLKTKESLLRKVEDRYDKRGLRGDALFNAIQDALRFTIILPLDIYAVQVQLILDKLEEAGYKPVNVDNFWPIKDDYNGINCNFTIPGSVLIFELQFHTDASFRLKDEVLHDIFKEVREFPSSHPMKKIFFDVMTKYWDFVKSPSGVDNIGTPRWHDAPPKNPNWHGYFNNSFPLSVPEWLRTARLISYSVMQGIGMKTGARASLPLLSPLEAAEQGLHLASMDYPEMGDILWDRPDLIEISQPGVMPVRLSSRTAGQIDMDIDAVNPVGDTTRDKNQPLWWRKIVGPAVDRFNQKLPGKYRVTDISTLDTPDWCRFRTHEARCMFPRLLDEQGTKEAGYSVWIPEDRGACTRYLWQSQKECKISEPGPFSGELVVYPDATVPWDEGGQRVSIKTSAWADVRRKAKEIRKSDGVHIISSTGQSVTAQIRGNHGVYLTTITRVPGTKQSAMWTCSCPWQTYAWARSGRWKYLEGRMCAHSAALLFEIQAEEMFGGKVVENQGIPTWKPGDVIEEAAPSQPSRWRVDAAVLDNHERSLRLALKSIMAADRSEHSRQALRTQINDHLAMVEVDRAAQCILPDSIVSIADIVESFPALVNGQQVIINELDFDERVALTPIGKVPLNTVIYPTYDPRAGLNYNGSKTTATTITAGDFFGDGAPETANQRKKRLDEYKEADSRLDESAARQALWDAKRAEILEAMTGAADSTYENEEQADRAMARLTYSDSHGWETLEDSHRRRKIAWSMAVGAAIVSPFPAPDKPVDEPKSRAPLDDRDAVLHEPEPALPHAYADMEDDYEPAERMPITGVRAGLEWLSGAGDGDGDADISSFAKAHLAKQALKNFSPSEQQMIINEGADGNVGASNLDRLELTGTYYDTSDDDSSLW